MTRADKAFVIDTINRYELKKGATIELSVNDLSAAIWWHSPTLNLGWYPIAQIDVDFNNNPNNIGKWKTVFHREGCENEESWHFLVEDVIKFINTLKED